MAARLIDIIFLYKLYIDRAILDGIQVVIDSLLTN